MKVSCDGILRKLFLSSLPHCALGELGPYYEGSGKGGWIPKSGGHWGPPSLYPSDPVPSTGKFWSSIFKLHLDSHHFSPPWSHPSTITWGPGDSSSLPIHPSPALSSQQPHMAPRSLRGKAKVLSTYEAPPKLEGPPLLPHHLTCKPCPIQARSLCKPGTCSQPLCPHLERGETNESDQALGSHYACLYLTDKETGSERWVYLWDSWSHSFPSL